MAKKLTAAEKRQVAIDRRLAKEQAKKADDKKKRLALAARLKARNAAALKKKKAEEAVLNEKAVAAHLKVTGSGVDNNGSVRSDTTDDFEEVDKEADIEEESKEDALSSPGLGTRTRKQDSMPASRPEGNKRKRVHKEVYLLLQLCYKSMCCTTL